MGEDEKQADVGGASDAVVIGPAAAGPATADPAGPATPGAPAPGVPVPGTPVGLGSPFAGDSAAFAGVPGDPSIILGATAPRPPRAPTATLGWVAIGLVALCVIADAVAVTLAVERYWVSATVIAQGTNLATAAVFVLGLFAAWRRPARWLGILAMVVAVLANPFILTHVLAFLAG